MVVRGRKSHLTLELRTLQMTSGLWYTKISVVCNLTELARAGQENPKSG